VICEVIADAFCYSMVRGLVAAVIQVGEGKRDIFWPKEIMLKGKKITDLNVVSANALVLEEVTYPHSSKLKEQYEITRQTRKLKV
jgi:tRNA pseudouridine38-40 synthase